jgi:divalent metal cation (Fe/Co/Zn/Cd) transporter
VVANVGVLVAAGTTYLLASRWPDIIVGCIIAGLFLRSAFDVLRDSVREWRLDPTHAS